MPSRRSFFRKTAQLTGAVSLTSLTTQALAADVADALLVLKNKDLNQATTDEELWARLAQAYTVTPNYLNLNNGGVSPQPKVVQDAVDRYYHFSNELPTYYMWSILDRGREQVRKRLADLAGTSSGEIAINRNTTEGLATVAAGLTLNKGDEIVMSKQDYPNMINTWKQKEMREGIKINWISFDLPVEEHKVIVDKFINATTSKTKVWHITHMINWTGQIFPVKLLCDEARKRGIVTIVDAAHTFAHLDYKISDFNPDYLATSLHKWLCAPFGTGMLYVNKKNVEKLWPLFPGDKPQSDDIKKFETLGTRSFAPEQAISQAVEFHLAIGSKRKEERLRYLKNYWCEKVANHPKIKLHASMKPEFSCALASLSVDGIEPDALANKLVAEQILVSPIKFENISCIRVTPHVYTLTRDLDRFVEVISKIANG
jgi:selenocysteine lyase/cysteine desulfurase